MIFTIPKYSLQINIDINLTFSNKKIVKESIFKYWFNPIVSFNNSNHYIYSQINSFAEKFLLKKNLEQVV